MDKKVAIITGASRGMGKAVAVDLAAQGYHVVLLARSVDLLQAVKREIVADGGSASYEVLDVSDQTKVQACVDAVVKTYGRIDVLFNNAGIVNLGTSDIEPEALRKMVEINLLGIIYVGNAVAAQMKQQRSGYIFNVSSIAGKENMSSRPTLVGGYIATKRGVSGYAEALYKELAAYDVKVTTLCPGPVATDMTKDFWVKQEDMTPTSDIVATVNYLLNLNPNTTIEDIVINCRMVIKTQAESAAAIANKDYARNQEK